MTAETIARLKITLDDVEPAVLVDIATHQRALDALARKWARRSRVRKQN